jgi:hypothetical protein
MLVATHEGLPDHLLLMVTQYAAAVSAFGVQARHPASRELRCRIASAHPSGTSFRAATIGIQRLPSAIAEGENDRGSL